MRLCKETVNGRQCIGEVEESQNYCAVHQKFFQVGAEDRCRKCLKKIRVGTWAKKRDDGNLEHQKCPPTK